MLEIREKQGKLNSSVFSASLCYQLGTCIEQTEGKKLLTTTGMKSKKDF